MDTPPSPLRLTLTADAPRRLDKALAAALPANLVQEAGLTRSRIQGLIAAGHVRRAGQVLVSAGARVAPGDELELTIPPATAIDASAQDIALDVLYEDDALIVVNKPPGMVVHPAPGAESGTLVNALLHHCAGSLSGIGGALRPGIVHRIDKDTSGVLVVAKTDAAHRALAALFADHSASRTYVALCHGTPSAADPRLAGLPGVSFAKGGSLRISGNIDRHPNDRKRMAVTRRGGRHAVTHVRVLARFGPPERPVAALIACQLETGRTHQIRVHMAHIGHPLVGDPVYGRPRAIAAGALTPQGTEAITGFARQALHALSLGFVHPHGQHLRLTAPLPADFTALLAALGQGKAEQDRLLAALSD